MKHIKLVILSLLLLLLGILILTLIYTPKAEKVKTINLAHLEEQAFDAENEGNLLKAITTWKSLVDYNPKSPYYLYQYGKVLSWEGKYDAAMAFLERALSYEPGNPDILLQMGLTQLKMGDFKKGSKLLRRVLEDDPDNPEALAALKIIEHELITGQEVKQGLQKRDAFSLARLVLIQAEDLYEKKDYKKALPLFITLYALHPQFSELSYGLGKTYAKLNENKLAETYLTKSLAIDPENFEALMLLGRVQLSLGDKKAAKPVYKKVSDDVYDSQAVRKNLVRQALEYEREGKLEQASEMWSRLAGEFPESGYLSYRAGLSYYNREMYEEAAYWLAKSLAVNPEQVDALVILGYTQLKLGKAGEAEAIFTRAVELSPDYEDALKGLDLSYKQMYVREAEDLQEKEKWDEAFEFWMILSKQFPNSSYFAYQSGYSLYRQDRFEEAVPWLEKSLDIDSENVDALVILGYAQMKLDQYEKAVESFSRAVRLSPDYEEAAKGLELAQRKQLEYRVKSDLLAKQVFERAEKLKHQYDFDAAYHLWVWLYNRHSDYPLFVYSLGNNYLVRGKYCQANWLLRRALELDPKYEDAWVKYGYTYLFRACLLQACSIFEYSVSEFPESGQAYLGLGRTYRDAHLVCRAKKAYQKAVHYFTYPDQAVAERELHYVRRHTDPNVYIFTAYGREIETDLITNVKSADRRTNINLGELWQPINQRTRLMGFGGFGHEREIAIQSDTDNFKVRETFSGAGFDYYATPWMHLEGVVTVKDGKDDAVFSRFPFQNTTRFEPRSLLEYRYLSHRAYLVSEVDSFIVKDFLRFNSYFLTRWKNEFTYQYQWRPTATFLGCTGYLRKYDDGNNELKGLLYFQFPYPKYVEWLWIRQEFIAGHFSNTRVDYYSYKELWEYNVQAAIFKYIFPTTYAEISYLHAWRNTIQLSQPVTSPVFVPKLFLNINKVFFNLKQNWTSDLEFWVRTDYYWDSSDYTAYTIRGQIYYNF